MEPGQTTIGALLRRHRLAAGLTQDELAERAHLSVRGIADIERGVTRAPRRDTVALLAEALHLVSQERKIFEAAARHLDHRSLPQRTLHLQFRAASTPEFVGRTRELRLLDRHLAGEGLPLLLLAGEPGIGKSRLLAEVAWRAEAAGWRVLQDGCQGRGGQEPYAPSLGALKRYIQQLSDTELSAALLDCEWLVRMLPELSDGPIAPLPAWTVPPEQERCLMFEAVARFLANVHGPAGTLLVLDDLQWARNDALDLLSTLVRSPAVAGMRVVGAYRDTEVEPRDVLSMALADLVQVRLATHHTLAPLAPEEARQLLDGLLDGFDETEQSIRATMRTQVLQRAEGIPFFIVSCAQGLRLRDGDIKVDAIPWDVAHSIRQRVATLPEDARMLLDLAAVVGREVPIALLVVAAARAEEAVATVLEEACRRRLLVEEKQGSRFAHDVIREVIEADLGLARRQLLHRRVAVAMELLYADRLSEYYELLAFHYQQAEIPAKALAYLVLSGDKAAAAHAAREALVFYGQAFALCETLGHSALTQAIDIVRKRGAVLSDQGDFHGAAAEFARMRAVAIAATDRRNEGMALAFRGTSLYYAHDFAAAEDALRMALAVASERCNDVRFFSYAQLGSLLAVTNRHAEAAPLLAMAERLAVRVDDPYSQAWWSIIDAEWLHWSGRYDDALAVLKRWLPAVEANNQLIVLLWHRWALALLNDVIATCESIGEAVVRARAANTAGWIYGELQDHVRALDVNKLSLAIASTLEIPDTELQSNARLNLGDCLLALGSADEAEEHFLAIEQVVKQPHPQDHWMLWRYAQHLFHSYGELWLGRGDLEHALAYADRCLALAEPSDSAKNIVKACRLRGQVLLAQGKQGEAEREIARALQLAQRLGNPPQLWKSYAALGELRNAQGNDEAARAAYNAAVTIIDQVARGLAAPLRVIFLSSPHIRQIYALV
jgi:tetratricopeptide (TPR) repeat protein/transcriptional regulator with XRE-family HTH domain